MTEKSTQRPRPTPARHAATDDAVDRIDETAGGVQPAEEPTAAESSAQEPTASASNPQESTARESITRESTATDEADESGTVEAPADTDDQAPARAKRRRGPLRRWVDSDRGGPRRAGLVAAVAGVLTVLVAVLLVVLLVRNNDDSSGSNDTGAENAANQEIAALSDEGAAQAFVAGATSDIASVTSYGYKTLSSDIYNGLAVTTGAYRSRYRVALSGLNAAKIRQQHRSQSFSLAAAGIGRVSADGGQAQVLIFGTQSVRSDATGGKTSNNLVTLDVTVRREGDTYLISGLEAGGNAGLPPGTDGLTSAAEAARQEISNLVTMRRAHLQTDFRAALGLAVDPLRSQLAGQAGAVRSKLTKGGYDLTGEVTAIAVQSAAGNSATILVAATGNRTTSAGKSTTVTDGRYQVQVVRTADGWRVSQVVAIMVA